MEALTLLKQEINKTTEQEHDLAKWKLGVTAALGAAAFGMASKDGGTNYWLLLFVPFVCAYIDLYAYQYQIRIQIISQFLSQDPGDETLKRYEQECQQLREKHVFSLGNWAGISCSLGASVIGPIIYWLRRVQDKIPGNLLVSPLAAGIIWLFGVAVIVVLWVYFDCQTAKISGRVTSFRELWRDRLKHWWRHLRPAAPGRMVASPR